MGHLIISTSFRLFGSVKPAWCGCHSELGQLHLCSLPMHSGKHVHMNLQPKYCSMKHAAKHSVTDRHLRNSARQE